MQSTPSCITHHLVVTLFLVANNTVVNYEPQFIVMVLRGSLRQQTAFSLVLIALEWYSAQVNMDMSKAFFSMRLTVIYIIFIWLTPITIYSIIVFNTHGFYLSVSSFSVCEPYYRSLRMLVLTSCIFYFPTTMVLMYCYGTIYHSQKLKMKNRKALCSALPMIIGSAVASRPIQLTQEADSLASLVRCLSAISLSFIILVTPWSILQVITSVTMEQPSPSVDFTVNILFSSFSFISPAIFWLLNPRMRRTADLALYQMGWCWSAIACCSPGLVLHDAQGVEDVQPDEIDEQFWGEILERTVSVNNMNFGNGEFGRDDLDSLGGEDKGMGKEGAVGLDVK